MLSDLFSNLYWVSLVVIVLVGPKFFASLRCKGSLLDAHQPVTLTNIGWALLIGVTPGINIIIFIMCICIFLICITPVVTSNINWGWQPFTKNSKLLISNQKLLPGYQEWKNWYEGRMTYEEWFKKHYNENGEV